MADITTKYGNGGEREKRQLAYSVIKPAYSEKVQRWFENLNSTVDSFLANAVKTLTDRT